MKAFARPGSVVVALVIALALPAAASAASVQPTVVPGNPTCSDLGYGTSAYVPVDNTPNNQTYTNSDGFSVTISGVTRSDDQSSFSFAANQLVEAVIVKGGHDQAAVYVYDPDVSSDSSLTTSDGTQISHITFCYDLGDQPPPPPPSCSDTSASTGPGTPVDVGLPCSGTGSNLTCSIVGMPQTGTLGDVSGCSVTYTPSSDCNGGTDTFTYEATDSNGTSNVATATITIAPCSPPPAPPTCNDTSAMTSGTTTVDVGLPCSGTGDDLSCAVVGMPANGTVGAVNGCSVSYTPNSGTCQDTFTYDATDSNGTSNIATATITVTGCESNDSSPPTTTTPPAQLEAPAQEQAPAQEPGAQEVLGERVSGGSAKLLAATGCAGKPFTARVRGAAIARVVFTLDGKKVLTLTKPNSKGLFALRVNPLRMRVGVHRLVATVTFNAATRLKPRILRASFQRCAQRLVAPRFTG